MKRSIAFFDFDGTITRKDTMLEIIKFYKGSFAYYLGLVRLSPWLLGMKAGIIPNSAAKEKMLSLFFKGVKLKDFNDLCMKFSEKVIPSLIRSDALETIAEHKRKQHEIVVVTASAENWVLPWCKSQNLELLATSLQVDEHQKITGKLLGLNCNGAEKVSRITSVYNPADFLEIYCYGDSDGDREMLSIATHPFFQYFKH